MNGMQIVVVVFWVVVFVIMFFVFNFISITKMKKRVFKKLNEDLENLVIFYLHKMPNISNNKLVYILKNHTDYKSIIHKAEEQVTNLAMTREEWYYTFFRKNQNLSRIIKNARKKIK